MIDVGIITFHYINNYGALLQAFALKKAIDNFEGYHAEIINYIPEKFEYFPYEIGPVGKEKMEKKISELHRFLIDRCEINMQVISDISKLDYDIYCVGSDQVWNFNISQSDLTYLLDVIPTEKKRISYASSIGLPVGEIERYKDVFIRTLSKFDFLSVREAEHAEWIKKKLGLSCKTVLDPTFLIDVTEYEKMITGLNLREKDFVLFLWYDHDNQLDKAIEFVNTVSRKYVLPIVHNLVHVRHYKLADDYGNMFYEGVENFLWYIKNAKVVVTNSYHTMLFSIHFETPFYVYIVESMRSRFDTLGAVGNINQHYVEKYIEPKEISIDMDFRTIKEELKEYTDDSREYLANALGVAK